MRPRILDPETVRELYYDKVMTVAEIQKHFCCGYLAVVRALEQAGFQLRPRGPRDKAHCRQPIARQKDKAGYWLAYVPDHPRANAKGLVREHRLVLEKKIGRYLLPTEDVHHKDENKANNDPDNLELMPSRSDHIRHHNLQRSSAAVLRAKPTEELAAMYQWDSSVEIARRYGTSPASVQRLMIERGIQVPPGRPGRRATNKPAA